MMEYSSSLLWLFLAWLTIHFLLSKFRKRPNKLPPGPFPLPIIGNLLSLGSKPHKSLTELSQTYGPLMTLQLGQVPTVVVSSAAIAKQVLQKNDLSFCNRTIPDAIHASDHGRFSMGWMSVSAPWRNLRKISNSLVFSSSRLDQGQDLRQQKVADLLSYVDNCSKIGAAVDIGQAAFSTTLNLISTTLFSEDFLEPGSDAARQFKDIVSGIMEESGKPNFTDFFPVLRRFDLQGIRHRVESHFGKIMSVFNTRIDQRLKGGEIKIDVRDVLDVLLNEELERPYIVHLILDFFIAGGDTTSSTLEWAMAELLRNPDKLRKAEEELNQVIGRGERLKEGDIVRLPYLQSVVKETFRLHPPVPFLLPRKVEKDVELCGFTVPENAQVFVNIWAIGRDPGFWENPSSFEPERFLGSGIDVRGHDFELIPFGAGRRICPGLPLAIRMLHLMLGSLVHSFDWKLEGGAEAESMDMEEKFGITLQKAKPLRAIPSSK